LFILTPGCIITVLGVLDSRLRILILLGGMLGVFGILALVFAWTLPGFPKNGSGVEQNAAPERPRGFATH
jgi:hypothetical protein